MYLCVCKEITSTGFNYIGENLHQLKELNVCYCEKITDENVNLITANNKNLERLLLSKCASITSCSFKYIGKNLNNLKELHLGGCTIFDDDIKFIVLNNKKMESLTMFDCDGISEKLKKDIKEIVPKCDVCF